MSHVNVHRFSRSGVYVHEVGLTRTIRLQRYDLRAGPLKGSQAGLFFRLFLIFGRVRNAFLDRRVCVMQVFSLVRSHGSFKEDGDRSRPSSNDPPHFKRNLRSSRVQRFLRLTWREELSKRVSVDLIGRGSPLRYVRCFMGTIATRVVSHQIIKEARRCRLRPIIYHFRGAINVRIRLFIRLSLPRLCIVSVNHSFVRTMKEHSTCSTISEQFTGHASGRVSQFIASIPRGSELTFRPFSLHGLLLRFPLREVKVTIMQSIGQIFIYVRRGKNVALGLVSNEQMKFRIPSVKSSWVFWIFRGIFGLVIATFLYTSDYSLTTVIQVIPPGDQVPSTIVS